MKPILTFCQHCHMKCRIRCRVEDGRLTGITGDSRRSCPKAQAGLELVYHPDRIIHPLKRTGGRGEGKWQRISWDEALDTMARRFGRIREEYGPAAIATIWGSGHKVMASAATFMFSQAVGTPVIMDINQQCDLPLDVAQQTTFGENILSDQMPYFRYSRCILIWGSGTSETRPPMERDIRYAQSHGAKVIRVDPRPAGASACDLWLRIRPGTDGALALGMLNVIINEGLYNQEFVAKWCLGFDKLKAHVPDYPLEKVAEITWVPAEKIAAAARLFARSRPSSIFARLGVGSQQVNATQNSRAVCILAAVAGDIDIRGGNLLGYGEMGDEVRRFRAAFAPGIEAKRPGAAEYPLFAGSPETVKDFTPPGYAHNTLCRQAMLGGEIKALYIPGCNLVVSEGDSRQTAAALKRLDFLAVADLFMTPTAELADLVLPAAHFLETEIPLRAYQYMGPRYMNYVLAPRRVIPPAGQCWDDRRIVIELAKRMGNPLPWPDIEGYNDWLVAGLVDKYRDISGRPGQLLSWPLKYRKYIEAGFRTPSGKVEIYSTIMEQHGYDPLPSYLEPPQSPVSTPDIYGRYPLILTSHRDLLYTHSEFRQIPALRKRLAGPSIDINPDTARAMGINEGDRVYIERPGFTERVYMTARFSPEMHPGVVSCVSHWWFPERPGPEQGGLESNINTIISADPPYDPISMCYQMRGLLCRVGRDTGDGDA